MKTARIMAVAVLMVGGGLALQAALAQQPRGKHSTEGAPLRETVTVGADQPIPNVPGKRLVTQIVDYPPGVSSAPHRHGPAFIYAYVVSGAVRSQVDDEPARIYKAGEAWFEKPGAHHKVSANASDTEPARLLAVFIVDEADKRLVTPDAK